MISNTTCLSPPFQMPIPKKFSNRSRKSTKASSLSISPTPQIEPSNNIIASPAVHLHDYPVLDMKMYKETQEKYPLQDVSHYKIVAHWVSLVYSHITLTELASKDISHDTTLALVPFLYHVFYCPPPHRLLATIAAQKLFKDHKILEKSKTLQNLAHVKLTTYILSEFKRRKHQPKLKNVTLSLKDCILGNIFDAEAYDRHSEAHKTRMRDILEAAFAGKDTAPVSHTLEQLDILAHEFPKLCDSYTFYVVRMHFQYLEVKELCSQQGESEEEKTLNILSFPEHWIPRDFRTKDVRTAMEQFHAEWKNSREEMQGSEPSLVNFLLQLFLRRATLLLSSKKDTRLREYCQLISESQGHLFTVDDSRAARCKELFAKAGLAEEETSRIGGMLSDEEFLEMKQRMLNLTECLSAMSFRVKPFEDDDYALLRDARLNFVCIPFDESGAPKRGYIPMRDLRSLVTRQQYAQFLFLLAKAVGDAEEPSDKSYPFVISAEDHAKIDPFVSSLFYRNGGMPGKNPLDKWVRLEKEAIAKPKENSAEQVAKNASEGEVKDLNVSKSVDGSEELNGTVPTKRCSACQNIPQTPLKRCGGCKRAFYCNEQCQREHWQSKHKLECKALRKS